MIPTTILEIIKIIENSLNSNRPMVYGNVQGRRL